MKAGDVMVVAVPLTSAGVVDDHRGGEAVISLVRTVYLERGEIVIVIQPETLNDWCIVRSASHTGKLSVLRTALEAL